MAQEESRSISENITWGQRKRFADGRYSVPYSHFLGYDKGDTNELIVNPEQVKIVRLIFRLYLEGKTERTISFYLKDRNIPSPSGKQAWSKTTVNSILTNEKYKGDALLQKSFTVDFLEKKMKKQPEVLDAWDNTVWTVMVEKAIVHRDGTITFVFWGGTEIAVERQAA